MTPLSARLLFGPSRMPSVFAVRRGVMFLALVLGLAPSGRGLSAEPTSSVDAAPKLLSTAGGKAETWSDVRELEAAAAKGNPQIGRAHV